MNPMVFFSFNRSSTKSPKSNIALKSHPHAEVKYKKILISIMISVRIKRKINPGRAYRQLVLEAEPHSGAEILKILTEGVRHNIGLALVGVLTLLIAGPVWRDITEVKKKGSGQIPN
jgi:hypothetical protein